MKQITATTLKILAFAAFVFSGAASAGFINSGFETGDFAGWSVGGTNGGSGVDLDGTSIPTGDFQPAFVNVRSGNYAAFGVTASTNDEFLSLSQTVNVEAGLQSVGFYLGHDDSGSIGINDAIANELLGIFVDGTNIAFTDRFSGNNFPNGTTPSDMYLFASEFTSQGGLVNIEFRISGSGTGRTVLSVDDTFITGVPAVAVPEPTSVALLGLGLLGLAVARRKRV